ncbi:MAG: formate dehydrogenase accessory sulfurtransferase FdhD [Myxococcota bacterium]|nr:formate dehydrogenase accessory sulfurtransferase FdhD [Myxococcota bacterium]
MLVASAGVREHRAMPADARDSRSPSASDTSRDVCDDEATQTVELLRVDEAAGAKLRADQVVVEEPLEIQLGSVSLAVVMRTPGHDLELVRGFLAGERVVSSPDEIESIRHCTRAAHADAIDNVVRVVLRPGVEVDLESLRRNLFASSSCGICGKATVDNALAMAAPLEDGARIVASRLPEMAEALLDAQDVFARTGGLHGAALFDANGSCKVVREDVGRHNAVDKAIGWALERGEVPLSGHALMVSGRVSFEIVQKALAARLPVVAAVSAPTSLAIDAAARAGIALIGFVRGHSFNVYTAPERVVLGDLRPTNPRGSS